MINFDNILAARLKRNNFLEYAGENFRSKDSKLLRRIGETTDLEILFGVENDSGEGFILTRTSMLIVSDHSVVKKIANAEFNRLVREDIRRKGGKQQRAEYLYLDEVTKCWVKNPELISAVGNTVLFLENCLE
ncbi:hypothetical protein SAMN05216474_1768 [Lishizhenia tianjinensis]|uniref:Uncharacterized protein n=1 Tax=Lishizhenia tianjinensis TaxID=477690 RepID=A0A1I6ZZT4_9FLAO|nr:hypothetical protein [Lishizhenia tianjinensis]SFT68185.1 hypothetical protein SAMN05216474_1768 [Lishizhenia tianjinensis]